MSRIKKAKIGWLSLVPRGANQMPIVYKSTDGAKDLGSLGLTCLTKANEELGELTNIVYPVEYRDYDGDIASAEVVKQMCYDAAKDGLNIDIRHDGKALSKDQVYVAENFIVQKGDPRFSDWKDYNGKAVDPTGAWATVLKIDDPELRAKVKDGTFGGTSMMGYAEVEPDPVSKEEQPPSWFNKAISKLLGRTPTPTEDIDVNKDELITVLKEQFGELAKTLKGEDPKPEPTALLKFEGDPSDPEAVQAHLDRIKLSQVDFNDPKSVEAHLASLTKKSEPEDDNEIKKVEHSDEEKAEIAKLRKQLAKLEGKSHQPDPKPDSDIPMVALTKSEQEAWARGEAMAKFVNAE